MISASGSIPPLLVVLLLLLLPAPGAASAQKVPGARATPPTQRYLFAGVPWLAHVDSALAQLAAKGYRELPASGQPSLILLRGRFFDRDAMVTGHLDERRRLVRWDVRIDSQQERYRWPQMRALFDEIVQESQARYGSPRSVVEKYGFPYERGDGWEDEALRDGKATLQWSWQARSGDRLTVEMTATVAVLLTYESPEWAELEARRRSKKAADL